MPFLTEKVTAVLIKIAIFAVFCLAVWGVVQMFEAKNAQLKLQTNQITQLQTKNKQLEEEVKKKAASDTVTTTVKADVKKEEVKVTKAKTGAQTYVEKKISDIDAKYAAQPQTPETVERKRTEISLERAKGLWLTFCLQAPEEQACK